MKNLLKKIGFISIGLSLAFAGIVSADRTFTLPNQIGHSGQFLQTNGTNPLWASAGGGSGGITGLGTVSTLPVIATVDGSNNILTLADSHFNSQASFFGGSINGDDFGQALFGLSDVLGNNEADLTIMPTEATLHYNSGTGGSAFSLHDNGIYMVAGDGIPLGSAGYLTVDTLGKVVAVAGGAGIAGTGNVTYFPRIATVDGSNNILTLENGSAFEGDNYYVVYKTDPIGDTAGVTIGAGVGTTQGQFVTQSDLIGGVFRNQIFYGDGVSGTSYIEQRPDGMELSMRDATSTVNSSSIQMDQNSMSMYVPNFGPSNKWLYATAGDISMGDVTGIGNVMVTNLNDSDQAFYVRNGSTNATFGVNTGANAYTVDITGLAFISQPTFSGAGLDDMSSGGVFTGTTQTTTFVVQIDSTGTPDSISISKNGTQIASNVAITGSAQTIGDGVTVTFGATTGHTGGNSWTITAFPNGIYNTDNGAYYNGGHFLIGQDDSNVQIGYQNGISLNNSANNFLAGQYSFQSATNISGITSLGNANGYNSINGSYDLIYIGHDNAFEDVDNHSGILMGANAIGYSNTFVAGSDDFIINDVFFGSGKLSGSPQATTIHGSGATGADIPGADITIAGGISTGDQIGGSVLIATTANGGSGSSPNNLQQSVQFDGNGNIRASRLHNNITAQGNAGSQDIRSGTYTPTINTNSNLDAVVPHEASWMRVGNVVTVQWYFEATPTTADVYTKFSIDLPVPTTFSDKGRATGSAVYLGDSHKNADVVQISGVVSSGSPIFEFYPAVASSNGYSATFTYLVE